MKANDDLIIKGGHIVLENHVQKLDITINNGKITALAENISGGSDIIDAEGQYVFPGMIDSHVHFSEPGRTHWEGFQHGSHAMAKGGCTTFFDMPLNGIPSTTTVDALNEKAAIGKQKSAVNFALWGGLVPDNVNELKNLADHGVIGFKAFLSPTGTEEFQNVDDVTLLRGMKKIANLGKVLALHSESGPIVSRLANEKQQQGLCSADDYSESRPIIAEAEAVQRVLLFAKETQCPVHFVHISSAETVEMIEKAKQQGLKVSVETCPHYLLFNSDTLKTKGAVAKCAPPLRHEGERRKLWQKVVNKDIDLIASDHSPCPTEDKINYEHDLFTAWGGISGGQSSLEAMIDRGYFDHHLSLNDIADITAKHPAQVYNIYPRKGTIKVGSDADFAIVDLNRIYEMREEDLLYRHPHSPYVNEQFRCQVTHTVCNGQLVYELNNGIINSSGKWLKSNDQTTSQEVAYTHN